MNGITRAWRNFCHRRKFAKAGRDCRFTGDRLEVEGHVELGDGCRIRNDVVLRTKNDGKIVFGNRSGCSYFVVIEATTLVQIGDRTGIAEFTVIRDSNHLVYGTDANWRLTPLISKPIIIGNDCLIGSRCYIMPGVTIGDGVVIQAGSLVCRDVPPYEIWAGMPARFLAHRTKNVPAAERERCEKLIAQYGIRRDRYDAAG